MTVIPHPIKCHAIPTCVPLGQSLCRPRAQPQRRISSLTGAESSQFLGPAAAQCPVPSHTNALPCAWGDCCRAHKVSHSPPTHTPSSPIHMAAVEIQHALAPCPTASKGEHGTDAEPSSASWLWQAPNAGSVCRLPERVGQAQPLPRHFRGTKEAVLSKWLG